MIFNISNLSNPIYLTVLLLSIPIIMFSLSFHEAAHAYAAHKLGDDTAKNLGRLTLNPIKHLDLFGFISMLLIGIGWAKPVPIMTRNFKNPKAGMILSSLAGPASNLLLSIIGAFLYVAYMSFVTISSGFASAVGLFLFYFHYYNLVLAVFNMLPIPPLDGSRLFLGFLPDRLYFSIMKYENIIKIAFIMIIMILSYLGISLISWICSPISNGMIWLFSRLPFFRM